MCRLNELGSDYSPKMTRDSRSPSVRRHPNFYNKEQNLVNVALSGKHVGFSGVKAAPVGRMMKMHLFFQMYVDESKGEEKE